MEGPTVGHRVGSVSILLLTKNGIYASRDRPGRTPLVIGERKGEYAIATGTCSFLNLGFKINKYLDPGEIVFVGTRGLEEKSAGRRANQYQKIEDMVEAIGLPRERLCLDCWIGEYEV